MSRLAYTCMVFALGVTAAQGDWRWAAFFLFSAILWGVASVVC